MSLKTQTEIRLAIGLALLNLAKTYPGFLQAIGECIQNAIDALATVIEVRVDKQKRGVFVRDNGTGVTIAKMNAKLLSVCLSDKLHEKDKLGRHGIGAIAFIGKCEEYRFISRSPENSHEAGWQWIFNTKEIVKMLDRVNVPLMNVSKEEFVDETFAEYTGGYWTSELHVLKYLKDVQWSRFRFEDLKDLILENYSVPMRERGITVWLTGVDENGVEMKPQSIRASDFMGKALKSFNIVDSNSKSTTRIRPFVIPRTDRRKGRFLVGIIGDPHRVSFEKVLSHLGKRVRDFLTEEVQEAFTSGRFEGELLCSGLIRLPNREQFMEDDAFVGFCEALVVWYEKVGKEYMDAKQDEERGERLQNLGRISLENQMSILNQIPGYQAILKSFSYGKIGQGHAEPGKSSGEDGALSVGVNKNTAKGTEGRHEGPRVGATTNPGHIPYSSAGPKGRKRTLVRNDSQGLHIAYDDIPESQLLWRFESETGTLIINRNNRLWERCEKAHDQDVMRLVENIIHWAVLLESVPDTHKDVLRGFLRQLEQPLVHTLLESSSFTGSRARNKSSKIE